jgi:hypothetical protein
MIFSAGLLELAAGGAAATALNLSAPALDPCPKSGGDEIVVCGSRERQSPYRLPKLSDKYERKAIRAETDAIPGVHARAHAESERMADGNLSKRLLVTFSLPF